MTGVEDLMASTAFPAEMVVLVLTALSTVAGLLAVAGL